MRFALNFLKQTSTDLKETDLSLKREEVHQKFFNYRDDIGRRWL